MWLIQLILLIHGSYIPYVFTNVELANTEPLYLGGNSGLGSCKASGHYMFVSRSKHNFVLCVFLFKNILFNIYY